MLGLGLGVGVMVRYWGYGYMLGLGLGFCLRGFNVFTQYAVRIETLLKGFYLEGILSGSDFVRGDYVRRKFCSGFKTFTR